MSKTSSWTISCGKSVSRFSSSAAKYSEKNHGWRYNKRLKISVIKLPVHPAAAKACMRASAALAGDIDIVLTATNKRNHQFWQTANPCIKYKPAFWSSCALILKNASTCNNYSINALCCRIISYFIHIQVHSFHLLSIKWQHCCDDEIFKLHCSLFVFALLRSVEHYGGVCGYTGPNFTTWSPSPAFVSASAWQLLCSCPSNLISSSVIERVCSLST